MFFNSKWNHPVVQHLCGATWLTGVMLAGYGLRWAEWRVQESQLGMCVRKVSSKNMMTAAVGR